MNKKNVLIALSTCLFIAGCGSDKSSVIPGSGAAGAGVGAGSGAGDGAGPGGATISTNSGSSVILNPGTGGNGSILKNFVSRFTCINTTTTADEEITFQSGSKGKLLVSCDPEDDSKYSLGSTTSLNITGGVIIDATVLDCGYPQKTKLITQINLHKDDGLANVKVYSTNLETNETVGCVSTYNSPLPTTISTDNSINELIKFTDFNTALSSDCPTTYPSIHVTSSKNCELKRSINIKLTDDTNMDHETTYIYTKKY